MKTTTILRAYEKPKERWVISKPRKPKERALHYKQGAQADFFHDRLVRRIEAGDRAREALRMIIDKELRGWTEYDPDRDAVVMSDIARSALAGGDNWPWKQW